MKIDEEVYVNGLKAIDKLCDKIINNKDYIANRILDEHEK